MKALFVALSLTFLTNISWGFDTSKVESLAIQDGGRIKPFDTFARESVQLLTGSTYFRDKNPVEVVLSWLLIPDEWTQQKFIEVNHRDLKRDLGLDENQKYFTPFELAHSEKLMALLNRITENQRLGKKNPPQLQNASRVANQLGLFQAVISGRAFRFVPSKNSSDWQTLPDLSPDLQESFKNVSFAFVESIKKNDGQSLNNAAEAFKKQAQAVAPDQYPSESALTREIWYNHFHPFRKAWIFYAVGVIILLLATLAKKRVVDMTGVMFIGAGFLIGVAGFVVRCLVAGRPPVSNMYESVIWVSSGIVFFGLLFSLIYKKQYLLICAAITGTIGMIVADSLPAVLDQSIKPLEPVLRSNYWLTIHVLTITLSYAAFGLALGIANFALSFSIFKPGQAGKQQQILAQMVYRVMQVGVVLITAGTILGGVWADYSWGRFWGWDPKETWALIALLCYLAVLHGRFAGWINAFRLHVCAVLCFSAVVMAWYGVNFVLGVGLHSYGFGAGGVKYVAMVLSVQLFYVAWAGMRHNALSQKSA